MNITSIILCAAAVTIVPGPEPGPYPEPIIGLPTSPGPPLATPFTDINQVSLCWGQSELVLNYFEINNEPTRIEFSVNGGPWVAARYGKIIVGDFGIGTYEVRLILYPRSGQARKLESIILQRTEFGWENITPPIEPPPPPPPPPVAIPDITYETPIVLPLNQNISKPVSNIGGPVVSYAVTAGILPAGITLNPDGSYSGVTAAVGTGSFTVTATNATGSDTFTVVYTVIAPPPPSPDIVYYVLQRGDGPVANPAPVDVSTHTMLPIDLLNRKGSVIYYGSSSMVLNLHDNTANGPVPQHIEYSLDGGPWYATRSAWVTIPDMGDGDYQIRIVSFPASGMSYPWPPLIIRRTHFTNTDSQTYIWWSPIYP